MLDGVKNYIYNLIPQAGTPNRTILHTSLSIYALSFFSSLFSLDQVRATATLGLKGRLSKTDPFVEWIKKPYPEDVKRAKTAPASLLISSQWPDLITKVSAAAGFYFTKDLSFYGSITNLLAHSEKVSKVAQPILDKIASLPIPYLLQATRVIAFAPVIAKLIHMALIWVDPKGENKALEMFKTGADRTAQGLEVLWNLRFSLLCLGISTTVYRSIFSIVYTTLVNRLVSNIRILLLLHCSPLLMKLLPNAAPPALQSFQNMFGKYDSWPTTGFMLGLKGLLVSLHAPSSLHDIETLEKLFNEVSSLEGTLGSIETVKSHISSGLKEGKISPDHAKKLDALLNDKISEIFNTMVSQYPENLNLETLLDGSTEKDLFYLFGKDAIIHDFAVTKEDKYAAYLLSAKFHLQRFELNLAEYLANPPDRRERRKEYELSLLYLGFQAELEYSLIAKSPEFDRWKKEQTPVPQNLATFIKSSTQFDFARTSLHIPENFKFETVALPFLIMSQRDCFGNAVEDPWTKYLSSSYDQMNKSTVEKGEMIELLQKKHGLHFFDGNSFLSSEALAKELEERVSFHIDQLERRHKRPLTKFMKSRAGPFVKIDLLIQKAFVSLLSKEKNVLKHFSFQVRRSLPAKVRRIKIVAMGPLH